MDRPYLSLFSLVKGWPQRNVRREAFMVTGRIDRLRGQLSHWAGLGDDLGSFGMGRSSDS
jgi:hypothetical protein